MKKTFLLPAILPALLLILAAGTVPLRPEYGASPDTWPGKGTGTEKGVGQFCLDWAFAQCGHLRIDTHTDNVVMQNLLSKLGFKKCGIIHVVEDNYPRYAYEKI